MRTEPRKTIAIDIDDVVANTIDAVRLWANMETGVEINDEAYHTDDDYWNYYNAIWQRHGVDDKLNFEVFLEKMAVSQTHIAVQEGAREVIDALKKKYDIVFISARPAAQKDETRRWLDEHISKDIPLYIAAHPTIQQTLQSKGEICRELGVSLLIDDNIDHCKSALEYDTDTILFGNYGWNERAPADMKRCYTWREVGELLLNEYE